MTQTPKQQVAQVVSDLSDTIDETILHALEQGSGNLLLASLAEARGGIVKMNHVMRIVTIDIPHDEPRTYADELPPLKPLPKGQKALPRVGLKLRSARYYKCPTCGAEPETNCFKFDRKGAGAQVQNERHPNPKYNHVQRARLAREYNEKQKRDYDKRHRVDGPS